MQVQLTKPKLTEFIEGQVKAGHFASAEDAVEAAVEDMMLIHGELTPDIIAAIAEADAQYARGEFVEWHDVRDDLRKKYLGK